MSGLEHVVGTRLTGT